MVRLGISFALLSLVVPANGGSAKRRPTIQDLGERVRFAFPAADQQPSELAALAGSLRGLLMETDTLLGGLADRTPDPEVAAVLEAHEAGLADLQSRLEQVLDGMRTKLQRAGLSAKVQWLDAFRRDVRARSGTVGSRWRAVRQPGSGAAARIRAARLEIAGMLGSEALAADSTPPFRVAPRSANLPPPATEHAPEDRQAVITITPEIQALADRLGRDPAKIYAYVHDNIEYAIYQGYMQSAQAVLWSREGNGFDHASLLIALMRAAGIPARYVDGNINMSVDQWMNWWGAKTVDAARRMAAGIVAPQVQGDRLNIDHGWAEILWDDGTGERWIPLDAGFKSHVYQPGYLVPDIPFDKTGFLAKVRPELSTEWYFDQIREYLRTNAPGVSVSDLPYRGTIAPAAVHQLPSALPYRVAFTRARSEEPLSNYHHRVVFTLIDSATPAQPLGSLELKLAENCLDDVTLSFRPATAADAATLAALGPAGTPAGLINMIPELRLNDRVVVTGNKPLAYGAFMQVGSKIFRPFSANPDQDNAQPLLVGGNVAIVLEGIHSSEAYVSHRVTQLLSSATPLNRMDPSYVVRQTLFIAGVRYNQYVREHRARMAAALQYRTIEIRTGTVTVRAEMQRENLFDRPFLVTHRSMTIGALGTIGIGNNYDIGNGFSEARLRELNRIVSMTGFGLESDIFEEIFLRPAMEATKGLQLTNERRLPVVSFTPAEAAQRIPQLAAAYPPLGTSLMQSWASRGFSILTPAAPVQYEGVRWITFFAEREDGGIVGELQAILSTGAVGPSAKGGGTGTVPPTPQEPGPGGTGSTEENGGTTCPVPVSISNGNMFHQFEDVLVPARGVHIALVRTYNSQSAAVGPFGYGWTHNLGASVRVEGDKALYASASGGVETLTRSGAEFVSSLVRGIRLRIDGDGHLLRFHNGEEQRFGADGRLQRWSDRNGNALAFTYDGQGRLSRVAGPVGRFIELSYDERNRIRSVQDSSGRVWTYSYDGADNLIESRDPLGNATKYEYYSSSYNNHNLKTITDPEGLTIGFTYYADDRIFKTVIPGGGERRYFYIPLRNETHSIDERGHQTSYFYDNAGRVTRVVDPGGNIVAYEINADGLVSARHEAGYTSRFEYDQNGNVIRHADAAGAEQRFTYEPVFNQLLTATDRLGNVTTHEYDARGNRIRTVDPLGGETLTTYDEFGNVLTVTDPAGIRTRNGYDSDGRRVEFQDGFDSTWKYEYDSLNRLTRQVNPLDEAFELAYDSRGLMTSAKDAMGSEAKFTYNANNNLTNIADASGNTTRYDYEGQYSIQAITDALGNQARYSYVSRDCVCGATKAIHSATNARGATLTLDYDFKNRPILEIDPLGGVLQTTYNNLGYPALVARPDGRSIRYVYDAVGRLTVQQTSDDGADRFTYDAEGNLLSASNDLVTYTFTYDATRRLKSVHDSRLDATIRYEHDGAGRRLRMIDPQGGVTEYSYNAAGALASIRNPAGFVTEYRYDRTLRLSEVHFGNGTHAAYRFDSGGRLTSLSYRGPADEVLNRFEYSYGVNSKLVAATDLAGRHTYTYDAIHQLTGATRPNAPDEIYSYDPAGNRMASASEEGFEYNAGDQLVRRGSASYEYDAAGNLVKRSGSSLPASFTHDAYGRLTGVEWEGGRASYGYDPLGRRIVKKVGDQVIQYLYDGQAILNEYDANNARVARFTSALEIDQPLILERDLNGDRSIQPEERFFYQGDRLGSIVSLASAAGAIVERYQYDSFGNLTVSDSGSANSRSAAGNPYLFTGREWDAETGLYYYRARYYDPQTGRFLQRDPARSLLTPASLNPYLYVGNDPLNYVDPMGREEQLNKLQKQIVTDILSNLAPDEGGKVSASAVITVLQSGNVPSSKATAETLLPALFGVSSGIKQKYKELEASRLAGTLTREGAEQLTELRELRKLIQRSCGL